MNVTLVLITLVSLAVAIIMTVVAWRARRDERLRSEARVAALAEVIGSSGYRSENVPSSAVAWLAGSPGNPGSPGNADTFRVTDAPSRSYMSGAPVAAVTRPGPRAAVARQAAELELRPVSVVSPDLFATAQPAETPGTRLGAVIALGLFVVGSIAALVVVVSGGETANVAGRTRQPAPSGQSRASQPVVQPGSNRAPQSAVLPLELVALGHELDGDRLTVRGIVRNPGSGAEVDGLTAVVFLFDKQGGFISSGRAAVAAAALVPGAEAPFVISISIPGVNNVGRYRVSFRTADNVVPHIDRRNHESIAQLQ